MEESMKRYIVVVVLGVVFIGAPATLYPQEQPQEKVEKKSETLKKKGTELKKIIE
jgi:hypothetical protein